MSLAVSDKVVFDGAASERAGNSFSAQGFAKTKRSSGIENEDADIDRADDGFEKVYAVRRFIGSAHLGPHPYN